MRKVTGQQILDLVSGNACMRKSDPKVFPHLQEIRNEKKKKKKNDPRSNRRK